METLKAGTPRIDLEGNPVGTVTDADEENAKRKITKAAGRAAAKAIEDRNTAGQRAAKPVAERAGQQNPIPQVKTQQPAPTSPSRVGLAGLKQAALARRRA